MSGNNNSSSSSSSSSSSINDQQQLEQRNERNQQPHAQQQQRWWGRLRMMGSNNNMHNGNIPRAHNIIDAGPIVPIEQQQQQNSSNINNNNDIDSSNDDNSMMIDLVEGENHNLAREMEPRQQLERPPPIVNPMLHEPLGGIRASLRNINHPNNGAAAAAAADPRPLLIEREIRRADRNAIRHERLRQRRQQRQELFENFLPPPRRVRIREERIAAAEAGPIDRGNDNDNGDPDNNNNAPAVDGDAAVAAPVAIDLVDEGDAVHNMMMVDVMEHAAGVDGNDDAAANDRRQVLGRRLASLRQRQNNTSPELFRMVKEGRLCTDVLSGWGRLEQGCDTIVQYCETNPDQTLYLSEQGRSPLHEACLRGACRHVIKALIAASTRGSMDRDHHGNTPLHLLFVDYSSTPSLAPLTTPSPSVSAAMPSRNSNIIWSPKDLDKVVGDLLEVNPVGLGSTTNAYGDTPLHSACMAPETMVDPNSIAQLLTANSSSASRMNRKNQTPLRLHCQRRNASPEVARLLLEANPGALTVLDNESGWAPIHYAASNANFELLRVLVEASPESANVRTTQRQTALHLLCQQHTHLASSHNNRRTIVNNMSSSSGFSEVASAVGLLLKADPSAIMHQDANNSFTPLHLVCKTEGTRQVPVQVVQLLLRCNRRAASVTDSEQYLPLHHACEMGSSLEVIEALIEAYPDATKAMTRKQDSAISLASTCNKSVNTVKLLIKLNPAALTRRNDYGFAPLHCVCRAHQPRMGIVQALVDACPSSVILQNNSRQTPINLASSNSGAFGGVLQLLTTTQNKFLKPPPGSYLPTMSSSISQVASYPSTNDMPLRDTKYRNLPTHNNTASRLFDSSERRRKYDKKKVTTNKMGNTPLHDACFKNLPFEQLEVIAKSNPEYILVGNNAGYTPLQILCKNGRIGERIVSTFALMGGPGIFSVKDSTGNTPLHSAMRPDINISALKSLIRASPDAIRSKTANGDSPLHLACLQKCSEEVIREVAMAASNGDTSPALESNLAGQTPIGIAMAEFRGLCQDGGNTCTISVRPSKGRIFQVLSTIVKIIFYGPVRCQQEGFDGLSLLRACVVLHRKNIRLDPAFIRQVIRLYPEEVKILDEDGNYPLHIEASIPVEKMPLLDGACSGPYHKRMGILRILLDAFPHACAARNKENQFPLGLMIQNGRLWGHSIAVALRAFPPALHWYKGLDDRFSSIMLEKASKECGADTLFQLLLSRPGLFDDNTGHRS